MPDVTSDTSEIASETIHDTNLDAIIADMERLSQQGKTPILAAIDGYLAGIVAVADVPKADSRQAIELLRKRGVEAVMLTGDNPTTARAIASQVGIDERHVIRRRAAGTQGRRNRKTPIARLYGGDGRRRHQRRARPRPSQRRIRHRHRHRRGHPIRRRDTDGRMR